MVKGASIHLDRMGTGILPVLRKRLHMAKNNPVLGSLAQQAASEIIDRLRAAGYSAYFAGGCVRDLLLGRDPADFDVATSATPEIVLEMFPRTFAVGAHFGVVLVAMEYDGAEILTEVATFRSDGVYSDGRRPDSVRYTDSAEQDVLRRDFTINGMLLDTGILAQTGELRPAVLDFVGGLKDLQTGVVRAIGNPAQRFAEDKLRMLRAVRFAARFGFVIENHTLEAIRRMAGEIDQVSQERVRDELTRMLTEGAARRAFELLESAGVVVENSAGSLTYARRRAARAVSSGRRCLDAHTHAARTTPPRLLRNAGLGSAAARCRQAANVPPCT